MPSGVKVSLDSNMVRVEAGSKKLEHTVPGGLSVELEEGKVKVRRDDDSRRLLALHGLTRSLISNMITGVSTGFKKRLQIVGRGKKAKVQGKKMVLELGFSHPVEYELPEGIEAAVEKNIISIEGYDKQKVGETAAKIRGIQPPEPYKGSGIRYENERVRKKAGKSAVGGGFTGSGQ